MFENRYEYYAGKSGTNETTGLVRKEEYYLKNITAPQGSIEYEYDANGNVTEIKNVFDTGKNVSYEYDSLNRLTKETNLAIGSEWRYTYDNGGNITRKEEYNPATGVLRSSWNYGYGDTYWKDQLTSWGSYGTSYFAYDSSGNPTKYKGKTLTWEGKRLTKYSASSTSNMELSYDGSGMLIGYTQSDTYTDWAGAQYTNVYSREMTRDGDRILTEKVTSIDGALLTNDVKNVKYMYDAKGASGMIVDGTKYYFRKNIFGDVVEIYNESGAKCAEYAYDAWGTCYTTLDTNGVGSLNPFRYRGYYFVSRIGLYYLTTRFYDYMTGRFLNADVPSICFDDGLKVPEGCNLYSYCRNNPISYVDPTGHSPKWWQWLLFGIGAALVVGAITVLTMGVGTSIMATTMAGAVMHGAAVGTLIGASVGAGLGAVIGGATSDWSVEGILEGAMTGFGIGAFVGAIAGGSVEYFNYTPNQITGFTKHGINNAISKNGVGVSERAMLDTVKNPTKIVSQALKTKFKYVGKNAVVILNKTGKVITTWAKHKVGRRIGGILLWLGLNSLYEN